MVEYTEYTLLDGLAHVGGGRAATSLSTYFRRIYIKIPEFAIALKNMGRHLSVSSVFLNSVVNKVVGGKQVETIRFQAKFACITFITFSSSCLLRAPVRFCPRC